MNIVNCVMTLLTFGFASNVFAQARQPRTLQELWRVDDNTGLVLMQPDLLRVTASQIVVFDNGTRSLQAISHEGRTLWSTGRKGGGPGEFASVADLLVTSEDEIVALDAGNARLAFISTRGTPLTSIKLEESFHRIVSGDGETYELLALSRPSFVSVNRSGRVGGARALPATVSELSALQREGIFVQLSRGRTLMLHRWSTLATVFDSTLRAVASFELRDPQPFPRLASFKAGEGSRFTVTRIEPGARNVVRDADAIGDTLVVLDARAGKDVARLDFYHLSRGAFLFSLPAPVGLRKFRLMRDRLIGLVEEPLPAVVSYRWSRVANAK